MARVPRHFRRQLASEKTGPNSLDTSAAESARAVSQMAGNFQKVAAQFEAKKRDDMMKSEGALVKAKYANLYAEAAREVKKEYIYDPDGGFEALQLKDAEIKDQVLGGVSNSRLRSDLGPVLNSISAQNSANGTAWKIGQMDTLDRQYLVDAESERIDAVIKGATEEEMEMMLADDTFTEEYYTQTFGKDGPKNFATAKNALFTARNSTLLEDGQFFAADDFMEKSKLPDELTRQKANASFLKMQKGAKAKQFFQTTGAAAIDVVEAQEKMLADDMTAAFLQDRVLAVSDQAEKMKDNPEVFKTLSTYAGILADIRDIKMESTIFSAAGNTDTETALQAGYEALFITKEDGKTQKDPSAFLSDFLNFQKNVTAAAKRGEVSVGHYNKWMYWSGVALQDLDFEDRDKMFGFKQTERLDKSQDKTMIKGLRNFLNSSTDKSNKWRTTVLQEVYSNIPADQRGNVTPETARQLFADGQAVANMEMLGLPVTILDSKIIKTSAGSYPSAGIDQDGMPTVVVDAKDLER